MVGESDLCIGFFLGFLAAGAIGFVLQRISLARRRIQDNRTQRIAAYTERTPREEVSRSNAARFEILMLVLPLIAVVFGMGWLLASMAP
jgi:hypothetical protein